MVALRIILEPSNLSTVRDRLAAVLAGCYAMEREKSVPVVWQPCTLLGVSSILATSRSGHHARCASATLEAPRTVMYRSRPQPTELNTPSENQAPLRALLGRRRISQIIVK